jgi:hypothetical protein
MHDQIVREALESAGGPVFAMGGTGSGRGGVLPGCVGVGGGAATPSAWPRRRWAAARLRLWVRMELHAAMVRRSF